MLPITISGGRALAPPGGFPRHGWCDVLVTVHPPLETRVRAEGTTLRYAMHLMSLERIKGRSLCVLLRQGMSLADPTAIPRLQEKTRRALVSALRPCDYYGGSQWELDQETFEENWSGPASALRANAAVGVHLPEVRSTAELDGGEPVPTASPGGIVSDSEDSDDAETRKDR